MSNRILCLETEWETSIHDLKYESQAKPMLEFLYNSNGMVYSFRQVATKADFNYYIGHLNRVSYKEYNIVYLCFHGEKSKIVFADTSNYDIHEFAAEHPNIFEGKTVHFGSCSTLGINENDIKAFKRLTRASMVTGYQKDVEMTGSFIFETWLLNALYLHPNYRSKRFMALAEKEMSYYVEKYKFIAF